MSGWRGASERVCRLQDAQALGLVSKKRSTDASERDEWLRAAWQALVARKVDAGQLVFVDEMGTHTSLAPLYA